MRAAGVCKRFAGQQLKAPATAKWPMLEVARVDTLRDSLYRVTSYVDAQNAFGALLRTSYACTVRHDSLTLWTLTALRFW